MSKKILVVDDAPQLRKLVKTYLDQEGYAVVTASDGQEALYVARHEKPDLIILDLMMPEVDGFGVLDSLKANPQNAHIPVIVVTAKELTPDEKERLRGRIHSLMQKGEFMNDELADEIRALLK